MSTTNTNRVDPTDDQPVTISTDTVEIKADSVVTPDNTDFTKKIVDYVSNHRFPEPAVLVATVASFLAALFAMLVLLGIDMSADTQKQFITGVGTLIGTAYALAFVIRQFVTPVGKAEQKISEAYQLDPNDPATTKPSL